MSLFMTSTSSYAKLRGVGSFQFRADDGDVAKYVAEKSHHFCDSMPERGNLPQNHVRHIVVISGGVCVHVSY